MAKKIVTEEGLKKALSLVSDELASKSNKTHEHDEYLARNLYVIKTSEEGYVKGYEASDLGIMGTIKQEHTCKYIPVKEGDIITTQEWITIPEDGGVWIACETYDSNKKYVRRVVTNSGTVLNNGTTHAVQQVTINSGEAFVRVSARMYSDGKVMVTKGSLIPPYALAIEDINNEHTHKTSEINGLQDRLDNKANLEHNHTLSNITDLDMTAYPKAVDVMNALNEKSDKTHTHNEFNPMTVEIENNNNNFSVGVDSVGTKYDIIESSESTIELNGQTLVNIAQKELYNYTQLGTSINDGTYATVDSFEEGKTFAHVIETIKTNLLKENTTYTMIFRELSHSSKKILLRDNTNATNLTSPIIPTNNMFTFTTSSSNSSSLYVYYYNLLLGEKVRIANNIVILEGDYTNVPLSYFEGLKSSAETNENKLVAKSVGKNLFNVDLMKVNQNDAITDVYENGFRMEYISSNKRIGTYIYDHNLEKGNRYTLSLEVEDYLLTNNNLCICIDYVDGTHLYLTINLNSSRSTSFTIQKDVRRIFFYMNYSNHSVGDYVKLYNVQIEKNSTATEYEKYKENITTITLNEPLRSLPNGVKDEVFIHDDKLVITRNCYSVTINGDNINYNSGELTNTSRFLYNINNLYLMNSYGKLNSISDKLLATGTTWNNDVEHYYMENDCIIGFISKSKLSSDDLNGMKSYLQYNPITLVYQLATPTYEWFELPSPRLYKDGHVFIESGAIPLTTTKHEVNTSIRSAIDTNTNELWDIKSNISTESDAITIWNNAKNNLEV